MSENTQCRECGATVLAATAVATGGICMACKKGIRGRIDQAKKTPRRRSPFGETIGKHGAVVAVEFTAGLWCYVRRYWLCEGFLPFFSSHPIEQGPLPDLHAAIFFDLWCYDTEPTPMKLVGIFPFEHEHESYGEPYFTAPFLDSCYRIHEMHEGIPRMRETEDASKVVGLRLQRRYQPHEFEELLRSKIGVWPTIEKR